MHCDYQNDGSRITEPGKFEGEPVFAPHFWNLGLEGFADIDNGKVYSFHITNKDLEEIPQLRDWIGCGKGRRRRLRLREDDNGFVHCF